MSHRALIGSCMAAMVVLTACWKKSAPVPEPAPRASHVELVLARRPGEGLAAALTMALRYRGRDVTVETVAAALKDVHGTTQRAEISAVAARFGLDGTPAVKGMSYDFSVTQLPLGSLLVGDRQVGVLAGQETGRTFQVLDPEIGERRLAREELAAAYSSIYSFEPALTETQERPSGRMKDRLIPILSDEGWGGGGVEALAMTLRYLGATVELADIRAQTLANGETSGLTLVRYAKAMGFTARGVQLTLGDDEALALLPPGSILHWNWDYWVVLAEVDGRYVHIVDPRVGWRRMTRAELWGSFTGVALLIEPKAASAPDRR